MVLSDEYYKRRRLNGCFFNSSGILRCLADVSRSRKQVRMYLCMAFGSLQRPSIMMMCEITFWRALSEAQPALSGAVRANPAGYVGSGW